MGYSVMAPAVVIRPILLAPLSENHSAPSDAGPRAIPDRSLPVVVTGYSVIPPLVVIRPILPPCSSVNHSAPSGPVTIAQG